MVEEDVKIISLLSIDDENVPTPRREKRKNQSTNIDDIIIRNAAFTDNVKIEYDRLTELIIKAKDEYNRFIKKATDKRIKLEVFL